nr:citrate synthase [Clostridia bacterium]
MIFDDNKYEAEFLSELCEEYRNTLHIHPADFDRYHIKRGLRNDDGTGVMAGLTQVCSVDGYYIEDGERVPRDGRLTYRGVNIYDLVGACVAEDRFGFEELTFLLLFGFMPTGEQLNRFRNVLSHYRELPAAFTEDVLMKAPSPSVMNRMQSAVAALYAYDPNLDELTPENVLRQSIQIIGRLPSLMTYSYQVKRRNFLNKSMYIHPLKPEQSTAQSILNSIRSDRKFTDEEAKLLDLCMMLHAEHGGGNCSTFAVRTLTSAGTDTYSAIAAGIGALKGSKHGGANMKVSEMVEAIRKDVSDITDEEQVKNALRKVVRKEIGDGTGLIYGNNVW